MEEGGDLIRFGQVYLKSHGKGHSISETLKWFDSLGGRPQLHHFNDAVRRQEETPAPYKILSEKPIYSTALFQYLNDRQIPDYLAQKYLKQVYFLHKHSQKRIFGLGLKTRAGGYDIRTPHGFKTMIGQKDITFIPGSVHSVRIDVFEGAFDFLSTLVLNKINEPQHDSIITNSVNLFRQTADFIKKGHYLDLVLWSDNDHAGLQFESSISEEFTHFIDRPIGIVSMRNIYEGQKDVNAWLKDEVISFAEKKQRLTSTPIMLKTGLNSQHDRSQDM